MKYITLVTCQSPRPDLWDSDSEHWVYFDTIEDQFDAITKHLKPKCIVSFIAYYSMKRITIFY